MSNAAKLSTIHPIALTVSDVETAVGSYRDLLALELHFRACPNLAILNAGGVRIMLTTPQGAVLWARTRFCIFAWKTSSRFMALLWNEVPQASVHRNWLPKCRITIYEHDSYDIRTEIWLG